MSRLEELIQQLCPDGVEYKRLRRIRCLFSVALLVKVKDDFTNGNAKFIAYKNRLFKPGLTD